VAALLPLLAGEKIDRSLAVHLTLLLDAGCSLLVAGPREPGVQGEIAAAFAAAAGQWVLTALILIFGTLFDGLDGTLARATGKTSDFGAFLDSTMDRAGEAVIYAGIAAGAAMNGKTEVIGLATLALGTGSLVSYVRARGEGLGVCANIGIAQRAERAAVLIVGLLAGGLAAPTWLTAALLIISVASAITVVQRIRFIRAGLAAAEQTAAQGKVSPRQ
jgi:CDP-diacylglycerol--glycerol-3-phosphate 3-phosphatidyltransferase